MVTNLCPAAGNEQWCKNNPNSYGYDAHFDLMDHNLISGSLHWDNPEVTYEAVSCPSGMAVNYKQCQCAKYEE